MNDDHTLLTRAMLAGLVVMAALLLPGKGHAAAQPVSAAQTLEASKAYGATPSDASMRCRPGVLLSGRTA